MTKLGAKTKLSYKLIEQIADGVRRCLPPVAAARERGVPKSTFMSWLQKGRGEPNGIYRDLVDALDLATAKPHTTISNVMYESAKQGNIKAAIWLLEHQFSEEYTTTKQVELSGSATQPLQTVQLSLGEWEQQRAKQQAELEKTLTIFEDEAN